MKVCASCGASLPDQATFCVSCGSREFVENNYANPYQQPYQDSYNNQQYTEQYQEGYDQYQEGYDQQYAEQYEENYNQPYTEQYQEGYNQQYTDRYQEGYDQQYADQYQEGYDNQQYAEQYQDNNGTQQYVEYQEEYDQYQESYDNQPYAEQYPSNYGGQQSYEARYQDNYDTQNYAQSVQENVAPPIVSTAQVEPIDEPQPVVQQSVPLEPNAPATHQTAAYAEETVQEPKTNPYEDSKNFKFEKSENPQQEETEKTAPKNIKEFIAMIRDTKDHSFEYDPNDAAMNKTMAIVACLGITFWVPMAFKKDSMYARFYANQGLLMFIVDIICSLLYSLFSGIVGIACTTYSHGGATLSFGGFILDFIFFVLFYAFPVFLFVCAVLDIRAGRAKDIPILGKLRLIRV